MSPNPNDERDPAARRDPWPTNWVRAVLEVASVSAERRSAVLRDIQEGSVPSSIYYAMLGLSELIAGFALIIDSDATLIGANVVAPLMTPIFGIALGLARGDLRLLRNALVAEFGGAIFGVGLCYLLGLMPLMLEPTAALLAQTRPTLIDLFVAALAGLAGGLALIDDRVSPALPGVAIATALNPPIAAIGLCLASGAYGGAWGAFLLFFANVLAILGIAATLFVVAGFVTRAEIGSGGGLRGLARRFAAAAIGLLLVTGLLTKYLVRMVGDLGTSRAIRTVLDAELEHEPSTALAAIDFRRDNQGVDVLSTVSTPRVIAPERVAIIQEALRVRLGEPVRLFMRCDLTKDVTATGSTQLRPYLSLNGDVTETPLTPDTRLLQQAEQAAREAVATRPQIILKNVDLVHVPSGPVLVFSIESPSDPSTEGVARFEAMIRERLAAPHVRVVIRKTESIDVTTKGRILFGAAHFDELSGEDAQRRKDVEDAVRDGIQAVPNMFVTAIDAIRAHTGWTVRAEVVGPRVPTPAEVHAVEERATKVAGVPVEVSAWARTDLLVTGTRYEPRGDVAASPADDPAR